MVGCVARPTWRRLTGGSPHILLRRAHMVSFQLAAGASLEGFMSRIREVNNLSEDRETKLSDYAPLVVEGKHVGLVNPAIRDLLLAPEHDGVFTRVGGAVTVPGSYLTQEARTAAVARVLRSLHETGAIPGWRDELYPVVDRFGGEPLMLVERATAAYLGIKAYGVHVNGFVVHGDGRKQLWVARRSASKPTWPGMLDHIVAGGQPHGLSPLENVVKECMEEASIPETLARRAVPVGAVSYECLGPRGVARDCLFVYDLELPADFVPQAQDGEVEEFFLMDLEEVAELVRTTTQYKPNCNLVVIDFLVRHGVITPENPGYLDLVGALRSGSCC